MRLSPPFRAAQPVMQNRLCAFARVGAIAALTALAACSTRSDQPASGDSVTVSTARADTNMASPDTTGGMAAMDHSTMENTSGMAPMGGATGDPDRDFLRMMSDHHTGMIAMAHLTVEDKKGSATTRADAVKIDTKQDAELDSMATMLQQQYKDTYSPMLMPDNQKMVDGLKAQSGAAYDRMFYQQVVKHHQQATQMIDHHLPTLKSAQIKAMAERMKRDQTREIAEFRQKP